MDPYFTDPYTILLKLDQERKMLNLTEEDRLIRTAKIVRFQNWLSFPVVNPKKLLTIINERISLQKKTADLSLQSEMICCAAGTNLNNQPC
jgi:hypothetical protein